MSIASDKFKLIPTTQKKLDFLPVAEVNTKVGLTMPRAVPPLCQSSRRRNPTAETRSCSRRRRWWKWGRTGRPARCNLQDTEEQIFQNRLRFFPFTQQAWGGDGTDLRPAWRSPRWRWRTGSRRSPPPSGRRRVKPTRTSRRRSTGTPAGQWPEWGRVSPSWRCTLTHTNAQKTDSLKILIVTCTTTFSSARKGNTTTVYTERTNSWRVSYFFCLDMLWLHSLFAVCQRYFSKWQSNQQPPSLCSLRWTAVSSLSRELSRSISPSDDATLLSVSVTQFRRQKTITFFPHSQLSDV